jgi:DNA polymerase-1
MDLLLIDGPNLAYRAHHALPHLTTEDGRPSAAIFGFASMLNRVIDDHRPRHVIVAWEGVGSTQWRRDRHPAYKAHRSAQPAELSEQLVEIDRFIRMMGATSIGLGGAEADDVLATLTRQAVERAWHVGVVSSDKDLYALLRPGVRLLRPTFSGGMEFWDMERFENHYGIKPTQWQVRTALAGDPSDGIPGVKSIGEKTALKLIKQWGDLDHIYANLANIHPPRCAKLHEEGRDSAYVSYEVAGMLDDLPIELDDLLAAEPVADPVMVAAYVDSWGLRSLASRLAETARRMRNSRTS